MSIEAPSKTVPLSVPRGPCQSVPGERSRLWQCTVSNQGPASAITIGWDAREAWRLIDRESNDWDLRTTVGPGVTAKVE